MTSMSRLTRSSAPRGSNSKIFADMELAGVVQTRPRMNRTLLFLTLALLSACGPQSVVTDGTYKSSTTAQLADASLVIDLNSKKASVTLAGASSATELTLTAVPAANWEKGCPTNFSSVAVETWTVSPDPTVLGNLTLTGAKLLAGCGLDKADPDSVVLKGTGDPNSTQYLIEFKRR